MGLHICDETKGSLLLNSELYGGGGGGGVVV